MGLETQDTGGTPSLPELATAMQEDGTREENANILNLFLSGSNLLVGAPSPISAAQTTEPADGLVFNSNFTRERYGKAAVSDNITLDADKKSLLLDDNQTSAQKALSILGALEFENGLAVVQSMSDAEVTATVAPENVDQFSRRPESVFINTAKLNSPKRNHFLPSFTGQAEPKFIDAMVSRAGGDPANFATFGDVVADQTIMQSITADDVAFRMLSLHPSGRQAMVSSQTALENIANVQTAVSLIASNPQIVSAIEGASTSGTDSVPITNDAPIYVAELKGAGGGGGDNFRESGNGSRGEDTTFHQSVAQAGSGGLASGGDGPDNSGNVSSPDEPITITTGAGGSGGSGIGGDAGDGGNGGFVKALIVNPDRQSLTLSIGAGGSGGGDFGRDGADGSATIFTPNVFS